MAGGLRQTKQIIECQWACCSCYTPNKICIQSWKVQATLTGMGAGWWKRKLWQQEDPQQALDSQGHLEHKPKVGKSP